MKAAEKVAELAAIHETEGEGQSEWLARQFSRIEGFEGDDTLCWIADLMRAEILSVEEAHALTLQHFRETNGAGS
ncbi:hypothetical protein HFO91_30355 [Rhizobium leguminosarum]|uniref:hypothetical protein n=1 Tax=Rhizobium leguminosarum TaxID=384 RepID=UPI001C96F70E|nr:hypothetical protein [Rhizobium leguminosarum]MBY5453882.1 hypothetical protein [Rhizobium leguminosarum]